MVKASPRAYIDGETKSILPGSTITQLRDHFIGEEKGLRHLSVLLAQREQELRNLIAESDKSAT
jgi:hypothetical protein